MAGQFCPRCMTALQDRTKPCPVCGGDPNAHNAVHFLPVGTTLTDPGTRRQYLVGSVKGNGGFGVTYIGREVGADRLVAIKEYFPIRCQPSRSPDGSLRPPAAERDIYEKGMGSFLQEAEMLKKVSAIPAVVKVRGAFRANGTAYMVMDYLKGTTLRWKVTQYGPMDFDDLMEKLLPMAEGLARVHDTGLIHRDIAPDNIMLTPENRCVLMDFGCARSMEDGRSMSVVLKEGFAPVEQYTGHGQKAYTDVYALCATIYYCITGQVPPASSNRLNAWDDHQPDPLKPPSALGAKISPKEEQALLWGMALQSNERPKDVRQLLKRLWKIDPDPDPTFLERVLHFIKENKLLIAALAVAVIALVWLLVH